jgi:polyhydroxyalkanoate synthesis regulator phasin
VKDAIKGYLALATGLTEVTKQRATSAAKALVAQGEATAGQVQALTDDLVAQSKNNREAVVSLVKYEVDKALGRVGLIGKEEVEGLKQRIKTLETQLRDSRKPAPTPQPAAKSPAAKAPAAKAPAKRTAKAPAKKAAAKRPGAKKATKAAGA